MAKVLKGHLTTACSGTGECLRDASPASREKTDMKEQLGAEDEEDPDK